MEIDMSTEMSGGNGLPKGYEPQQVESRIREYWLSSGVFNAEVDHTKNPFCIVIPPPNVTGILHMGHALDNAIQDLLTRWKRMSGYSALWLPGTDHAGIATQNVAEKELAKEGLTMIIVTHEMAFARDVASHVVYMQAGVICEEGPPDQIFMHPEKQETKDFLARFLNG
jgi:valyl-tRNA synthetase